MKISRRQATLAAVAAAGALAAPRSARAAVAPLAQTKAGRVQGTERDGIKIFRGVPYGADTSGANRWLPAKPVVPWSGVRQATAFGPAPPQVHPMAAPMQEETDMLQTGAFGEDCLKLNVYTPAVGKSSGKRAVMVWFHGGGYFAGSGNATSYDGVNLARKQDVVLVSVTHRLNHFGFLYLGDLYGEAYADSGNVGILDCVAALAWVRDNIANFGGDPGRVMIFGQSGGGGKVSTLMGMPAAKGLFHCASAQSGAAVRVGVKAQAAAGAKRLIDALGVKSLAELQATPWERIIDAGATNPGSGGSGPIVDGRNLPAHPFDPVASPLSRDIPLISSTVETESAAWGAPIDPIDDAELLAVVRRATQLSDADAGGLIETYRAAYPDKDNTYLAQLLLSQWTFTDGVTLQAERKATQALSGGAPSYYFYFAHHGDVRGGKLRAPHTSEIPYCFDSLAHAAPIVGPVTPDKQALADEISAYWANFAKTGNPNGKDLPDWRPFDLEHRSTLVITVNDRPTMVDDPMGRTRRAIADLKTRTPLAGA